MARARWTRRTAGGDMEAIGELDHTTLKSLVKSLDFTPSATKELSEHHPTCRA